MRQPRLNRLLVLEAQQNAPDGGGGFAGGWAAVGELWCGIDARTGGARDEAGHPVSAVTIRIVVRAAPQGSSMRPVPGQRLRDGARIFAIRAVAERDGDGRYLTCFTQEEVVA